RGGSPEGTVFLAGAGSGSAPKGVPIVFTPSFFIRAEKSPALPASDSSPPGFFSGGGATTGPADSFSGACIPRIFLRRVLTSSWASSSSCDFNLNILLSGVNRSRYFYKRFFLSRTICILWHDAGKTFPYKKPRAG